MGSFGKVSDSNGYECACCGAHIPYQGDYWLAILKTRENAVVCSQRCQDKMETEDIAAIKSGRGKNRGMFAHDLDAARGLADMAGFGLVVDAGKGIATLGRYAARQAAEANERAEREAYRNALMESQADYDFLNNLEFDGVFSSARKSVDKLFSMYQRLSVNQRFSTSSKYPDINERNLKLVPLTAAKITAGIALLRTMPEIDVKQVDKMQLRLQKMRKAALKGESKYSKLMSVMETITFDGGEKLITDNLKSVLGEWAQFNRYLKSNLFTFPQRQRIVDMAVSQMQDGIDAFSKLPDRNEKAFAEFSQRVNNALTEKNAVKGTFGYVNNVPLEGNQKTIKKGIEKLFDILSAFQKEALKKDAKTKTMLLSEDEVGMLFNLGNDAITNIEKAVNNLSGVPVNTVDKIKIRLQVKKAEFLVLGDTDPFNAIMATIETISFNGGSFFITNQVKKLFSLQPNLIREIIKEKKILGVIINRFKNREQRQKIIAAITPKLDEALTAINNANPEDFKKLSRLIPAINKAKGKQ